MTGVQTCALPIFNGGYFLANYRPTGWAKDKSGELGRPNHKSTRGGVVAIKGKDVFIGKLADLPFKADFAVQNSPLLIEPDGSLGIAKDDGRRAARTIACLVKGDPAPLRLIVLAPRSTGGPTLKETAQLLHTPRDRGGLFCSVALNLDGGPSTGIWLAEAMGEKSMPPPVPIGYGVVLRKMGSGTPQKGQ